MNTSQHTATLYFHGGAGSVTGANFVLDTGAKRIMVDCGLTQGCQYCEEENRKPFPYDPQSIDVLFVTHAHIDHIGRIPKLVRDGFRGRIISTPATHEIVSIMFADSVGILEQEAEEAGKEPLYTANDVQHALGLWEHVPYHEPIDIGDGVTCVLKDAGHILGSAMLSCTRDGRTIVFTGDLGNTPAPLVRDTEPITDANYLVMESVYGNREHEDTSDRTQKLHDIVCSTMHAGGVLMIPAFSLERTQTLLFELNRFIEDGDMPEVPVFLDSPLAIKLTRVYRDFVDRFGADVQARIKTDDGVFSFPGLTFTESVAESKAIADAPEPKIIIAGSGMSNAGRIRHHEKRYLPDAKNTLLLIGYQAAGSLGRELSDGAGRVTIFKETIPVRARVAKIDGYSAHKDMPGLIDFVGESADTLEHVYTTMGEPQAARFLAQRLRDTYGINTTAPTNGDSATLTF